MPKIYTIILVSIFYLAFIIYFCFSLYTFWLLYSHVSTANPICIIINLNWHSCTILFIFSHIHVYLISYVYKSNCCCMYINTYFLLLYCIIYCIFRLNTILPAKRGSNKDLYIYLLQSQSLAFSRRSCNDSTPTSLRNSLKLI